LKKKILHLINNICTTSIPIEIANNLDKNIFKVFIISLYDNNDEIQSKILENNISGRVFGIGLKNKFDIIKYNNLYKTINHIKPDIIHTHHTLSGFFGRIFGKILKVPIIIATIHANMNGFNRYQQILRGLTLNLADCIVCNSKNTLESFLPWQNKIIDVKKKRVIYNGVDINKVISYKSNNIRYKYNIDKEVFLLGNVGRLVKKKNQKTLIKAFKVFKNDIKEETKLLIVGDGPLRTNLLSLVDDLNLKNDIIFTGLIPRKEVYKIINSLDLFIMTSIFEGFCNAIVEAMVAGNSIIATNIQPLPEVIGEGNGIFFKKGDYKDLVNKMLKLYRDKNLKKELSLKAQKYAINNRSLEKCIQNYQNLYLKLIQMKE